MIRRLLLSFLSILLATASTRADSTTNKEDERLAKFFKEYLETTLKRHPVYATTLGDHRYDNKLDDLSKQARLEDLAFLKETLQQLPKQIDYKKLSTDGRIDFEILKHQLEYQIWQAEQFDPFANDPRTWTHYVSDSVYLPLTQSTLPKKKAFTMCTERMQEIPRVIRTAMKTIKNPPKIYVDRAIRQIQGAVRFYSSGIKDIIGEEFFNSNAYRTPQKKVLRALKEYLEFLSSDLLAQTKGDWRIGKEKFATKLELELNAGLTLKDVQTEANKEFARVVNDMYVIARQLWAKAYPGKPLPPDTVKGRRETIHKVLDHFNKQHGKPEDLVKDAKAGVKEIKEFISKNDILRLPDPDRCQIIEMPEFQRGFSVAYLNSAPPLDSAARSVYAISPPPSDWNAGRVKSFMEEYNKHMLQILTIHEAYPGHYVQLEYSNRHPSLIRKVLYSGVFAEGWAVYTEQMMLDQGYGNGNLALRLNQLKFYLRAVANAILDYRMHCTDITDREALAFLMDEVFQSEGEAVGKVIRAKQSSCQLSTYFVGRTAFYRLRQKVQQEMGDKFDLGRYHEAVLSHGTLPVKYLPTIVRARLKQPR